MADTSALFSMQDLPEGEMFVPPGVIDELRKYEDPRLGFWESLIHISHPSKEATGKVEEMARSSGDIGRLSPVDVSVLALAQDIHGTILTDDYSIQNVARLMDIDYKAVGMKGIKKIIRWDYRCIGCGKRFREEHKECPICGSAMKSVRRR